MSTPTGTAHGAGLPAVTGIDTDARIEIDRPGVRIWFENGAKIQVVEDEQGTIERQWYDPDNLGDPRATDVVDEASGRDAPLVGAGLETVAAYLTFEDEDDARTEWGRDLVAVLVGE